MKTTKVINKNVKNTIALEFESVLIPEKTILSISSIRNERNDDKGEYLGYWLEHRIITTAYPEGLSVIGPSNSKEYEDKKVSNKDGELEELYYKNLLAFLNKDGTLPFGVWLGDVGIILTHGEKCRTVPLDVYLDNHGIDEDGHYMEDIIKGTYTRLDNEKFIEYDLFTGKKT